MKKFTNCDIASVLYEIMTRHTEHYKSDFDIDKEIFTDAANSQHSRDKRLLWLSRPLGTVCVPECDAYLKETYAHNAWKYYGEQTSDVIKAYAVKIDGIMNGTVMGDLYELDYEKHYKQVKNNALPIHTMALTFYNGKEISIPYEPNFYDSSVRTIKYAPSDLEEWNEVLDKAQAETYNTEYEEWDLQKLKDSFIKVDAFKKFEQQELTNLFNENPILSIYQLKDDKSDYLFRPLSKLQEKNIKVMRDNYNLIYVEPSNEDEDSLDDIFERFNDSLPKDFCGHSLSISDVVVLPDCGNLKAYYVDNIGFQEIPNFMTDTIAKVKGKTNIEM